MGIFGPSKKELKKIIAELESKNLNLANKNLDLTTNLNELKKENNKFQDELKSITLSKEEMQYLDLKTENSKLTKDNDYYIKEVENSKNILTTLERQLEIHQASLSELQNQCNFEKKKLENIPKKKLKLNAAFKSAEYALNNFTNYTFEEVGLKIPEYEKKLLENFAPSISLKLKSMDVKELKKAMKINQEVIQDTLDKYESKYTTKANKTIYKLMVIALQAELQNVLYNLKYDELNNSLDIIKEITKKYLLIASEGNKSIASTMTKFIGQIEYLFCDAVMIEYQYYVKKEQQRAEQAALREQMRQEAAEKKELERQRKQVEAEESKYLAEIEKLQEQLKSLNDNEKTKYEERLKELELQLEAVEHKKEDIINRQNGKAGNVYIISNLGSFGNDVFKIGMTRRLDPLERIKELGSASVPFTFDVHSFIFSDDAVSLEQKLHNLLNEKRVNKINLRKEFFKVNIDELEELVTQIDPTAEFNKTMLAEEYHQSEFLSKQECETII